MKPDYGAIFPMTELSEHTPYFDQKIFRACSVAKKILILDSFLSGPDTWGGLKYFKREKQKADRA